MHFKVHILKIFAKIHNICKTLSQDNAQKLGLTAVQGSYLVGLIGDVLNLKIAQTLYATQSQKCYNAIIQTTI